MRRAARIGMRFAGGAVRAGLGVSVVALLALGIGPRTGAYRTLTVLSGSMAPALPVGSVVVATPERPNDLRVGQVIVYEAPVEDRRVVSHRVVEVRDAGPRPVFRTKGDANSDPDSWVAQVNDSRVWRVRFAVPWAGWAIRWLRLSMVRWLLVFAFPGLLAASVIADVWSRPEAAPGAAPGAVRVRRV